MNRRISFQTAAALALLSSLMVAVRARDWPQFRGPLGNGVAQDDDKAPLHWGPTSNVRWKATLPSPDNSSPIVSHGRVFVTWERIYMVWAGPRQIEFRTWLTHPHR